MREFYALYDRDGQRYLAVLCAPRQPTELQFASYEELRAALNALGVEWELRAEIEDPYEGNPADSAAWLVRLATAKSLMREPKPDVYLWGGEPYGG